jgi:hypothetical protein
MVLAKPWGMPPQDDTWEKVKVSGNILNQHAMQAIQVQNNSRYLHNGFRMFVNIAPEITQVYEA